MATGDQGLHRRRLRRLGLFLSPPGPPLLRFASGLLRGEHRSRPSRDGEEVGGDPARPLHLQKRGQVAGHRVPTPPWGRAPDLR
ncbi:MAG TPA: hypothetical protein EYP55_00065 [Anaerolineae bacterium]|nr:hypothetical protein [Anaerolineae bacterium]